MKIEMGESLLMSWLKHAKGCKITQLNWKPSSNWDVFTENEDKLRNIFNKVVETYPEVTKKNTFDQFLSQAELDVIGIDNDSKYYAIDVAFHEAGLNYGSTEETVNRITKKLIRAALVLNYQFNTDKGEIIFATPKIHNVLLQPLKDRIDEIKVLMKDYNFEFRLIANTDFSEKILNPIIEMSTNIADTSELFMRAFQLYNMSNKTVKKITTNSQTKVVSNYSEFKIGDFVKEKLKYLFDNNLLSPTEIENLKDKNYCKRKFDINYPLLILKEDDGIVNNYSRYWKNIFFANKYKVTNDWYERNRQPFETWYNSIINSKE